jgi:hypothetical protein
MNVRVRTAVLAALVAAGPAVAFAQVTPSESPAPAAEAQLAASPAAPAPAAAVAQPVPPAAPPAASAARAEEVPSWTIGAGLGDFRSVTFAAPTGTVVIAGNLIALWAGSEFVPLASFFLERRVSERTWLVFGAEGSLRRDHVDAPADTSLVAQFTKSDAEMIALSAGLRSVVTRHGAPVEVSLQAVVEGGYVHAVTRVTVPDGTTGEFRDTGRFVEVTGGIAVERELTGGLAVRVSTPLVGGRYSKLERKDTTGTLNGTSASVFVTLSPRLELRLAF